MYMNVSFQKERSVFSIDKMNRTFLQNVTDMLADAISNHVNERKKNSRRLFQKTLIINPSKCRTSKLVVREEISARIIRVTESASVPICGKISLARVRDLTSETSANTVRVYFVPDIRTNLSIFDTSKIDNFPIQV